MPHCGYWLFAGLDTLDVYRSEPSDTPEGAYVLKTAEGKFLEIQINPPGTCDRLLPEITADLKKSEGHSIAPGACAYSEANRQALRQRDGRRSAAKRLGQYAAAFALIGGLIAAAWWIGAGFTGQRTKPT